MKITRAMLALATSAIAIGHDSSGGWKKAVDGSISTDSEGNPVWVAGDGKEQTIAPGYINRLNTEAATYRTQAREAQQRLEAFGDLDPVVAKTAVTKLKDVDFDALINKGELETVKSQMREQSEAAISEMTQKLTAAQQRVNDLTLTNAFRSSTFLNERVALPGDVVQAMFRDRFKVEDGKPVPTNERGEPLINKHGNVASVDEAFEVYINARTDKDVWLKAPAVGGSGSQGGGGGRGGGNIIKRADYDAASDGDKALIGMKAAKGEVQIVD